MSSINALALNTQVVALWLPSDRPPMLRPADGCCPPQPQPRPLLEHRTAPDALVAGRVLQLALDQHLAHRKVGKKMFLKEEKCCFSKAEHEAHSRASQSGTQQIRGLLSRGASKPAACGPGSPDSRATLVLALPLPPSSVALPGSCASRCQRRQVSAPRAHCTRHCNAGLGKAARPRLKRSFGGTKSFVRLTRSPSKARRPSAARRLRQCAATPSSTSPGLPSCSSYRSCTMSGGRRPVQLAPLNCGEQ